VSTVCSSAALDSLLDGNVGNHALVNIEALGLTVCLQVDQQFADSLDRLFWPSTSGALENLTLGMSGDCELSERDD